MSAHALLFGITNSRITEMNQQGEYDWIDPNRLCFSGSQKPEPTY